MIPDIIFNAYDIRGKYPGEINEKVVAEIISRFFNIQSLKVKSKKLKVIVGHDTRLSSPSLYKSVIKSLSLTSHFSLFTSGMITTPMLYFLVNHYKADFGIMITASHNPKEYNGLKIVGKKAVPISGTEIYKIIFNLQQPIFNEFSISKLSNEN